MGDSVLLGSRRVAGCVRLHRLASVVSGRMGENGREELVNGRRRCRLLLELQDCIHRRR